LASKASQASDIERALGYMATAFERSQSEDIVSYYLELLLHRGDAETCLKVANRASASPGALSFGKRGWYWIASAFRLCNLPDRARWALEHAGLTVFPDWEEEVVRAYRML
jgi:hypothetical protein